jgi:hypothetical protein
MPQKIKIRCFSESGRGHTDTAELIPTDKVLMMASHQTSVAEPIEKAKPTVHMPLLNEEECMEIKNCVSLLL